MASIQTHKQTWMASLSEAEKTLSAFLGDSAQIERCEQFTKILIHAFQNGGRAFSCGNGGSHCDAMHFAEEFTGRYRKDRRPLGALALGDSSHVTCVSNDYGFEYIFSRQLQGLARAGDVLVGLSTSGNSKNVILAFEAAKAMGVKTVALLGRDGGQLKAMADLAIVIPAQTSDRIQEMHIKILHTVIETVEREIFPENY
ncbi:MAG: D-sedoheptulose 7-phosphate isomerase [Bdellovibrionaceae bacterium]|nr:D-sedoheptulose 7-phosphate isomerase [Pseudobdellovibrionaceae bacterium]